MLHAVCCGEEAGARNLVFFRVKWLQPAMKGTVSRVCGGCGWGRLVPSMCSQGDLKYLNDLYYLDVEAGGWGSHVSWLIHLVPPKHGEMGISYGGTPKVSWFPY